MKNTKHKDLSQLAKSIMEQVTAMHRANIQINLSYFRAFRSAVMFDSKSVCATSLAFWDILLSILSKSSLIYLESRILLKLPH